MALYGKIPEEKTTKITLEIISPVGFIESKQSVEFSFKTDQAYSNWYHLTIGEYVYRISKTGEIIETIAEPLKK